MSMGWENESGTFEDESQTSQNSRQANSLESINSNNENKKPYIKKYILLLILSITFLIIGRLFNNNDSLLFKTLTLISYAISGLFAFKIFKLIAKNKTN